MIERDTATPPALRGTWSFGYDAAGNRFSAMHADGQAATAMTATHNNLNQITSLGGGGRTLVAGMLDEPGEVSVAIGSGTEKPARMLPGNRFETEVNLPANTTSTLRIEAADTSGNRETRQYSVATGTVTNLTYDAAGNLLSDGVRTYEWDSLCRLTKITWAAGKITEFRYNGEAWVRPPSLSADKCPTVGQDGPPGRESGAETACACFAT